MGMFRIRHLAFSLVILLGASAVRPAFSHAMQATRSGHEQEPSSWSAAWEINDHGQIVGVSQEPEPHALYWNDGDGEVIALRPFPGDRESRAYGINASG